MLNQKLQRVSQTSLISIDFNESIFRQVWQTTFFLNVMEYIFFAGNKLITNVLQGHIGNNQAPAATKRTRPHYANNGHFHSGPNYQRMNYWIQSFPQFADNSR